MDIKTVDIKSIPFSDWETETRQGLLNNPDFIAWDMDDPLYEEKFLFWRADCRNDPQKFIQKYGQAPDSVYKRLDISKS